MPNIERKDRLEVLLAQNEGGALVYKGRVGTGFTADTMADLAARMRKLATAEPDRFTANMAKARRKGVSLSVTCAISAAAPLSCRTRRARPGAPVAMPVAWDELAGFATAHPFSIDDADRLVERAHAKALRGWGFAEQRLPEV